MGGELTRPIWVLVILLLARPARAMCPTRCRCNDELLETSCTGMSLAVVPIQLNPEVQRIDLSNNRITNIQFTLMIYYSLTSLNLSVNKIETLGENNLEYQHKLKHLNLSNNMLHSIGKESLRGCHNLTELDLSYNRLEELPSESFQYLHSLEILNLSNNQLVFLEEGLLGQSKYLRKLLLDDNQLLELPGSAIGEAFNLEVLSLSRNLLVSIEDGDMPSLSNLKTFLLNTNIISVIHPGTLAGLSTLEELDLSDNNFTSIPSASLAKVPTLEKLYFSGNFIRSVPPVAFKGLFQLRLLYLARLEFLTKIDSRAFVDNINLEEIWMDDNIALKTLPTRLFYGNPRVANISIKNNQLSSLEVSHFPLDQLKTMKLGGNPFYCNCSLLWLWRLEQGPSQKKANGNSTEVDLYIDINQIRCAAPETLANVLLVDTTEYQIDCFVGWTAVLSTIFFSLLLLGVVMSIVYFGPLRRRLRKREKREKQAKENAPRSDVGTYEGSASDKYIIGPPIIHDYHHPLPPWNTFAKNNKNGPSRQFDSNIKTRAHIVYV